MISFKKYQSMSSLLVGLWWGTTALGHVENSTNELKGEIRLAEALNLADSLQPEIHASRLDVQVAKSLVAQAALRSNPGFSLDAENFGGKNELKGVDAAEYTAALEQTLELGGKRRKRVRVAEFDQQLIAFDLARKRLDIRAETVRRFVALQGAQERLALSKESVELAEDLERSVAARVRAGKVAATDAEKAGILLAQQKLARNKAQSEVQLARIKLSAMWGSVSPGFERASGNLASIPSLPELSVLELRMEANPDLARWATELEQRQASLVQQKAGRLPDLTVSGGIRRYSETDSQSFVAGISVQLPLFDRNQGKVREAVIMIEKAAQQHRAIKVTASAVLAESYQALSVAWDRIFVYKNEIIPRTQSVFNAVQAGYSEGKNTYLDVLDARRTFYEARAEYIEALVSGHTALADVERVVGDGLPASKQN